jgi:hypothetical protein
LATSRRAVLAGLFASLAPRPTWAEAGSPDFLAAAKAGETYLLCGLTVAGEEVFALPLPARGHAGAAHPVRPEAVAFTRRPGRHALVIDCRTGAVVRRLEPPPGRAFSGHGTYLAEGALLATCEQEDATSTGRIGLWDSAAWRRLGEVPTHGLGPHDLRLMPDGVTLAVANGGIATDAADRSKLNLDSMRPSLAYLDGHGRLLDLVEPPPDLHRLSIRHLAVRGDGLVAFAMQWEGEAEREVPLVGLHRRGSAARFLDAPPSEAGRMQGYAGSVAFDDRGGTLVVTSPRGGRVQRFAADGGFLDAVARPDVCGAAPFPGGVLLSDGGGGLVALEDGRPRRLARLARAWDNHIVALR